MPARVPHGSVRIAMAKCGSDPISPPANWNPGADLSTARRASQTPRLHHVPPCADVLVYLLRGERSSAAVRLCPTDAKQQPDLPQSFESRCGPLRVGTPSQPQRSTTTLAAPYRGPPRHRLPSSRPYRKCRGSNVPLFPKILPRGTPDRALTTCRDVSGQFFLDA